jgi:hypothetical protein
MGAQVDKIVLLTLGWEDLLKSVSVEGVTQASSGCGNRCPVCCCTATAAGCCWTPGSTRR